MPYRTTDLGTLICTLEKQRLDKEFRKYLEKLLYYIIFEPIWKILDEKIARMGQA